MSGALRIGGAVLATLAGLLLLWLLRSVLFSFLFSLAVAAAFRPTIDGLTRRGLPRALALALSYGVAILALVALFALAGGPIAAEARGTAESLAGLYQEILSEWPGGTMVQRALVGLLPPPAAIYDALTGEAGTAVAQALLGAATGVFGALSELAVVLILAIYWSASQTHFERLWLSLFRGRARSRTRETWRAVEASVGSTIRIQLLLSVLAGVLLELGYSLIGVGRPAVLALIGALLRLVPWFGTALAVAAPLVANVAGDIGLGVAGALYTALVLIGLGYALRRVLARQRQDPLLAVVVLVVMARALGVWGAVLALPVAAAVQALIANLAAPAATIPAESAQAIDALRARLAATRGRLAERVAEPQPRLASLMDRLDELLDRAESCCDPREGAQLADEPKPRDRG